MTKYDVCADGELQPGQHKLVDVGGGIEVAVFRIDDEYYAIEDVCTHDDGPLAEGELDGHCVICPRHGAKFDLRTGAALTLPAYQPVETFPVSIEDGRIQIEA